MTPKRQRLVFVIGGMMFMAIAAFVTLNAFRDNLVFFYTPTEIMTKPLSSERIVRIGGLVKPGSFKRANEQITFTVTDMKQDVPTDYSGVVPDLFREGQGVVAEGRLGDDRVFHAVRVFAKHDENYMPPEVLDALKKSGHWKDDYKPKAKP